MIKSRYFFFLIYAFTTINFLLSTAFLTSHKFDKLNFHLFQNILQIYLDISFLSQVFFSISKYLRISYQPFCYWFLVCFHCGLSSHCKFLFFKFVEVSYMTWKWSVLVNVPCKLKKAVYSAIIGQHSI